MELIIRNPENPEKFFALSPMADGGVWICKEDGEGMGIRNQLLFKSLEKFYSDNF